MIMDFIKDAFTCSGMSVAMPLFSAAKSAKANPHQVMWIRLWIFLRR